MGKKNDFFAPTSVWRRPLPANAPVSPQSPQLVAELQKQVGSAGGWINTNQYTTPIYAVGGDQKRVRVKLDTTYPQLQRQFASVPVPSGAQPAKGGDSQMVVWQPSTDTMWEFWLMHRAPDGWHARWGGKMQHVSRNPGWFRAPEGATATSLPLVGGLLFPGELQSGEVDHALAVALPQTRAGVVSPPAQRTDGQVNNPTAIPEGTRFRLDPRLDLSKLGLSKLTLTLAKAVQRYGMIVRDKAGTVVFYGESAKPGQRDPWSKVFASQPVYKVMQGFPWQHLQAVAAPVRAPKT